MCVMAELVQCQKPLFYHSVIDVSCISSYCKKLEYSYRKIERVSDPYSRTILRGYKRTYPCLTNT